MSGLLITIEGIEASGKSTQARKLSQRLQEFGYKTLVVREPGGTPLGNSIREIFLSNFEVLAPESEVALLLASKRQLLKTVIEPALADDTIVICDRYTATLFAYQSGAKGISQDFIRDMVVKMNCARPADLTLFLRVGVTESMGRLQVRKDAGGENSVVDNKEIEFHTKLVESFEYIFYGTTELLDFNPLVIPFNGEVDEDVLADQLTDTVLAHLQFTKAGAMSCDHVELRD